MWTSPPSSSAWDGHARSAPGGDGAVPGRAARGLRIDEAPFDDWLAAERQRLRELALTALEKLLALDLAAGALEPAVGTGLRLLALDPLRESAHRTLMDAYVRQGRRTAALRQYQRCVEGLQRELGVAPEAATTRRFQEILSDAPPGAGRNGRAHHPLRAQRRRQPRLPGDRRGPPDLVLVPGWVSNVECFWEEPRVRASCGAWHHRPADSLRQARHRALRPGPSDALPTLEAAHGRPARGHGRGTGHERATLVGYSEGGTMCTLFAAT